jgi:hypothetical protein
MARPTADRLSRQALLERIAAERAAEVASKGKGTNWFASGVIVGLDKARHLIESAVAETEPEPTDQQVLQALQGLLWPPHDPDQSWSPDTIQAVSEVLTETGYGRPNYLDDKETD